MSRSSIATAAGTFLTKTLRSSCPDRSDEPCASNLRFISKSASSARLRSVMSCEIQATRSMVPFAASIGKYESNKSLSNCRIGKPPLVSDHVTSKTFIQFWLDDGLEYFLPYYLRDEMPHDLLPRQIPHLQILTVHKNEAVFSVYNPDNILRTFHRRLVLSQSVFSYLALGDVERYAYRTLRFSVCGVVEPSS